MGKVILVVGVAGAGKDTWIRENVTKDPRGESFDIHSSDDIREELFGSLTQEYNGVIFDTMRKRTFESLDRGRDVVYNATNLSRRRRISLFKDLDRKGHKVGILLFSRSLEYLQRVNKNREKHKRVPEEVLLQMYRNLQIPREGVDCHTLMIVGSPFFNEGVLDKSYKKLEDFIEDVVDEGIKKEIALNFQPHDTPYHQESIDEHIEMCIEAAGDSKQMRFIALMHDLGKGVCKQGGVYRGHEFVGAHYALNLLWFADEPLDFSEIVYQHMNAHAEGGLTQGTIERNKLSPTLVRVIESFAKNIDSPSRIVKK